MGTIKLLAVAGQLNDDDDDNKAIELTTTMDDVVDHGAMMMNGETLRRQVKFSN